MSFNYLEPLFLSTSALAEASYSTDRKQYRDNTMLTMMPSPHNPPHARRPSSIDSNSEDLSETTSRSSRGVRFLSADGTITTPSSRRTSVVSSSGTDSSSDGAEHSGKGLGDIDEERDEYNDSTSSAGDDEQQEQQQSRGSKLLGKIKGLRKRKGGKSSSEKKLRMPHFDDAGYLDHDHHGPPQGYDSMAVGAYMGIW